MNQTATTTDKLTGALGRLGSLATPVVTTQVDVSSPKPEQPAKTPENAALEALANAPKKPVTKMEEKIEKKVGRPTYKVGDLKADYVKISPKIPRALKDDMDSVLLGLRRRRHDGITSMEDLVAVAIHQYLKRLKD